MASLCCKVIDRERFFQFALFVIWSSHSRSPGLWRVTKVPPWLSRHKKPNKHKINIALSITKYNIATGFFYCLKYRKLRAAFAYIAQVWVTNRQNLKNFRESNLKSNRNWLSSARFSRHGKWKIYLAWKIFTQVANLETNRWKKGRLGKIMDLWSNYQTNKRNYLVFVFFSLRLQFPVIVGVCLRSLLLLSATRQKDLTDVSDARIMTDANLSVIFLPVRFLIYIYI